MDGKIVSTITSNLVSPFNRKHRILFTSRATKLLGLTFTGASCNEIDFACFCIRMANWSEYFYSSTGKKKDETDVQYITLSNIYNYLPLDSIRNTCWNSFVCGLDKFKLDQDSQWNEVKLFLENMNRNPLNEYNTKNTKSNTLLTHKINLSD